LKPVFSLNFEGAQSYEIRGLQGSLIELNTNDLVI